MQFFCPFLTCTFIDAFSLMHAFIYAIYLICAYFCHGRKHFLLLFFSTVNFNCLHFKSTHNFVHTLFLHTPTSVKMCKLCHNVSE